MTREFHHRWEWRLRSSPEALWPLVADTNRFDRDAGLPPVERLRKPDADERVSGHRVRIKLGGMKIEWDEKPFEWVRPERFGVERDYLTGPIKKLRVLLELNPDAGGGTRLVYQVWSQPRNLLGALLIPIQAGIVARKKFGETFRRYDKLASIAQPDEAASAQRTKVQFAPGGLARLESARAVLVEQGVAPELADRLARHLRTADEMELTHMRPYALADRWGVPRRAVLELFLRATRAGLLDLQWDMLCPLCRGAQSSAALGGVRRQVHCESCNIDFAVNFERSVELTFRPNAAVREIAAREYCIGGPGVTPHVVAQQFVAAESAREFTLALEPGRYRLRAASLPGGRFFSVAENGAARIAFLAGGGGWPDDEPCVSTKPVLHLTNATSLDLPFLIERMAWTDQAATAAEVTALQVFRDLFSSEALRPGEEISVGTLAVLFTDLRDSTQLYREIGDAPAFGLVMNHFDVLREAIAVEGGALVKTIGDAVMAVFRRPVGAVNAVLRAQRAVAAMGAPPLTLKAGIHAGPCIAVTLNERLDYFGSTVNFAARVQRFSEGGDVVISDAMRADPEVAELLGKPDTNLHVEPFAATIKGFEDARFGLWRVMEKRQAVRQVAGVG